MQLRDLIFVVGETAPETPRPRLEGERVYSHTHVERVVDSNLTNVVA